MWHERHWIFWLGTAVMLLLLIKVTLIGVYSSEMGLLAGGLVVAFVLLGVGDRLSKN